MDKSIEDYERMTLARLRLALQVLAAPPYDQVAHYPPFDCATDEMALDYDLWLTRMLERGALPSDQVAALTPIGAMLGDLSGTQHSAFWTNEALNYDTRWAQIRLLAQAALNALRWPVEQPPPSPDIFIPTRPRRDKAVSTI